MKKPVKKEFQGANAHRYKENPLEEAFARQWQEANTGIMGRVRTNLDYLMDPNNRGEPNPPLSDRDWLVANTVIQWLGSPVGQNFLASVIAGPEGKHFRELIMRDLVSRDEAAQWEKTRGRR
jgi:hypothetical protein